MTCLKVQTLGPDRCTTISKVFDKKQKEVARRSETANCEAEQAVRLGGRHNMPLPRDFDF